MPTRRLADRIPAKSDPQARQRYLGFLQQSLSAIHPTAIWRVLPVQDGMFSAFTVPETICLPGNPADVYLRATQRFEYGPNKRFKKERKVITTQYIYTLATDANLKEELFSWQWHPGLWPDPHVHVHGDRKRHVPTGRVAFEQVLLFTLTDYGVTPAKADAPDILAETLSRFQRYRSWA